MPIFSRSLVQLRIDSSYDAPIDRIKSLVRLNLLPRANEKGNNNTTCTPVPISRSTTYALLVRVWVAVD